MIRWPKNTALPAVVQKNLEAFGETSLALELDASRQVWSVENFAWNPNPPFRFQLRSDRGEPIDVVVEGSGLWRWHCAPEVYRR